MCQARRWIRLRHSASTGRSVKTPKQGTFRSEGDCRRKRSAQDGHARLLSSIPVRLPCQQTTPVLAASKQYRSNPRGVEASSSHPANRTRTCPVVVDAAEAPPRPTRSATNDPVTRSSRLSWGRTGLSVSYEPALRLC